MITTTHDPETAKRPARLTLRRLIEQADGEEDAPRPLDRSAPLDRSRYFLCPTVTPLYYTESYRSLTDEERLRYNQLTGLAFNEIISAFEELAAPVLLPAAAAAAGPSSELAECLRRFEAEERRHLAIWRELNRFAEPELYRNADYRFVDLSPALRAGFARLCRHPRAFPMLFWLLLAQEELSMEVARRSLALPADSIEPRFVQAYRAHLGDEVRHVQVDWYLIERFYAGAGRARRRLNAWLLREIFRRLFVTPKRLARRVIEALAREFPSLAPLVPDLLHELRALRFCRAYQEMMYSRTNHPLLFSLLDRFPEMRAMERVLPGYRPLAAEGPA